MLTGTMKNIVGLAGVPGMRLEQGQRVRLVEATNLPDGIGAYFAAPLDGRWSDGVERSDDDSILVGFRDVTLD